MPKTQYLFVVALVVAYATQCNAKKLAPTNHTLTSSNSFQRPTKIYEPGQVRCGEWQFEQTGSIYYKPFEPVEENERCVWIIGVPSALGYAFNLQYLGEPTNQPNSGQELIVSGVKHNVTAEPSFKVEMPTTSGFFNVTDSHVVIVTFHSETLNDPQTSRGFVLIYEAIFDAPEEIFITPISLLTTHQILPSPVFDFKYPVSGAATYDANELAAFVFPPSNSIFGCSSNYISYRGTLTCGDRLHVYHFNLTDTDAAGHWQYKERLCGITTWSSLNDDFVLIFFASDASTNLAGFWFNYLGC